VSEHLTINLVHRCVRYVLQFSCDLIKLFVALVFDCTCRASLENLVSMATDASHNLLRHFHNIKRRLTLFEEQKMSTQQHALSYLLDSNMSSLFHVPPLWLINLLAATFKYPQSAFA
jgi:hypothetical protein